MSALEQICGYISFDLSSKMNAKSAKKYRLKPHKGGIKYSNNAKKEAQKSSLVLVWLVFFALVGGFFFWPRNYQRPLDIPVKYEIDFPEELHRSSKPEMSAMTVIQGLLIWKNGQAMNDTKLQEAKETWRLHKGAYAGFALQELLNANNIKTKTLRGAWMNNEERILALQDDIRNGHPVIIMGAKESEPSYLLVLGYNSVAKTFEVYDPVISHDITNITYDNNNEFTGNMTYNNDELLQFWSGGKIFGFYNHYGITAIGQTE